MRWMDYAKQMGEMRNAYTISVDEPEGASSFGNLGVNRRVIFE
jgi:hypothetical protein